eukprot:c14618_g1_i1 orf=2-238(-)
MYLHKQQCQSYNRDYMCSTGRNVAISHITTSLDLCHPVSGPEPITILETLNGEGSSGPLFVGEMSESIVRHQCLGMVLL